MGRKKNAAQKTEWVCHACSFKNCGLLSYCEVCEVPKATVSSQSTSAAGAGGSHPVAGDSAAAAAQEDVSDVDDNGEALEDQEEEEEEEEEEDAPPWDCESCTYQNLGLMQYCEICETPRSTVPTQNGGLGSSSSTAQQPVTDLAHSASRPPAASEVATESSWSCGLCSFSNPAGRIACEMCNLPREKISASSSSNHPSADVGGGKRWERRNRIHSDDHGAQASTAPASGKAGNRKERQSKATAANLNGVQKAEDTAASSSRTREANADRFADEEERRLLIDMGWDPDGAEDEGGLEDWEISEAKARLLQMLRQAPREGLRERAQRRFDAWKAESHTAVL